MAIPQGFVMAHRSQTAESAPMTEHAPAPAAHALLRSFVIASTAFLTVVDLFATQAILPSLARAYGYFFGSPEGSAALGQLFDRFGWRFRALRPLPNNDWPDPRCGSCSN
jgi:hypothetical protein